MSERRLALMLSMLVLVLDQLSKLWIMRRFVPGDEQTITNWFSLVYARNTGAAFSLLANQAGWQRGFFMAIALIASIVILWLLQRGQSSLLARLGLGCILGGALGNLLDRVTLGYVVDFIWLHYGHFSWPAFNIADSAIDLGAGLLIWDAMRNRKMATAQPHSGDNP